MNFLKGLKNKGKGKATDPRAGDRSESTDGLPPPPEWTPAPEPTHQFGLHSEASEDSYQSALQFCTSNPPSPPHLLPSHIVEAIAQQGCRAWGLEHPSSHGQLAPGYFRGKVTNLGEYVDYKDKDGGLPGVVRVVTERGCRDTCLLSDLPILAGLYDVKGKEGVYFEVLVRKMEGVVAIGTACKPYPTWRLPGWNRLSSGLHLDDFRKFFEDSDGGRDYLDPANSPISYPPTLQPGDNIGLGFSFSTSSIFFTYNGIRLPPAFTGSYTPRWEYDVFAAIGVEGEAEVEVNFGGDVFRWKEGNEWAWRVEGHVGRMEGPSGGVGDGLPSYDEI